MRRIETPAARMVVAALFTALSSARAGARQDHTNLSEAESYRLPAVLRLQDGTPVRSAEDWVAKRRPEVLRLYQDNVYGQPPTGIPQGLTSSVVEEDPHALGGTAHRKQVEIRLSDTAALRVLHLLLYTPANATGKVPVFLCLHFNGNWAIVDDPGVRLYEMWDRAGQRKVLPPSDVKRGASKEWDVPLILSRGYGVAVICYHDIEPDPADKDATGWPGSPLGVRALLRETGLTKAGPDEAGAISAWAWGMSRGLDYLRTDPDVDGGHVAAVGQSRLGKTVLWAGAQDERFAMVVASCSGEGGAALSRRDYGENLDNMTSTYLYQFSGRFERFHENWDALPVDAHMLLSLIAPRPLLLNTGSEDQWSDPRGEFLAAQAVSPVYALFGKHGLADVAMPPLDTPVLKDIAFHEHTGRHAILPTDWKVFLDFADQQWKGPSVP
jgi:hypothetical protein